MPSIASRRAVAKSRLAAVDISRSLVSIHGASMRRPRRQVDAHGDVGADLHGRPGQLAVALRGVHVADPQQARPGR